jgi:hypothetical protein
VNTASSAEAENARGNVLRYKTRSLWIGVAAGFFLLALAWGALFTAARSAKVESVPLATQEGKP